MLVSWPVFEVWIWLRIWLGSALSPDASGTVHMMLAPRKGELARAKMVAPKLRVELTLLDQLAWIVKLGISEVKTYERNT